MSSEVKTITTTYNNPDHSQKAIDEAAKAAIAHFGTADIDCLSCRVKTEAVIDEENVQIGTLYCYISDWTLRPASDGTAPTGGAQ